MNYSLLELFFSALEPNEQPSRLEPFSNRAISINYVANKKVEVLGEGGGDAVMVYFVKPLSLLFKWDLLIFLAETPKCLLL